MRLWSIHPKYLDAKGLVALWREALLAKNVLEGKTKGYKHQPQLIRFRRTKNPVKSINNYLFYIHNEAVRRGYNFDYTKFKRNPELTKFKVTSGQVEYEAKHLLKKLRKRDRVKYLELLRIKKFSPHPLFKVIRGSIEEWEKNR